MKIACLQLRTGLDVAQNISDILELANAAADAGAQAVMTPEMSHILDRDGERLRTTLSQADVDPAISKFAALAKARHIHIFIGSMAVRKPGTDKLANRAFVFSPQGESIASYDKIHMFDVNLSKDLVVRESETYAPGDSAVCVNMGPFKVGLSICYDIRFPALYRHYAKAGAHIFTVPAAFTKPTGRAHWETLLRARAIENGAYVCAPAQGGTHADGRKTWGHSMIINPWGEIIAERADDTPGFIIADLDMDAVKTARARIPSLMHDRDFGA